MRDEEPFELLLRVLHERDIDLTEQDVKWAFDSPRSRDQVSEWVWNFLTPDNLLSKEEAEL